jgi:hypothetical protein
MVDVATLPLAERDAILLPHCRDERLLHELVARSGMAPIVAVYEDFAEDEGRPRGVLNEIADRLDPERRSISRAFGVSSDNVRQRDKFNLAYRDRFIDGLIQTYTGWLRLAAKPANARASHVGERPVASRGQRSHHEPATGVSPIREEEGDAALGAA